MSCINPAGDFSADGSPATFPRDSSPGDASTTGRPARTDPDHPLVQHLVDAATDVYGRAPHIWPMSGGSGPNYLFANELNVPIITLGVGYAGSRIHAPNENIRISDFRNGIRHMAALLLRLGNV